MDHRGTAWIRAALVVGVLGVLVLFLASIGDVVQLVVVAALLAYLLDPLTRRVESYGASRTLATAVVFTALLVVISSVVVYLVPLVMGQLQAARAHVAAGETAAAIDVLERRMLERIDFLGVEELNLRERLQTLVVDRLGNVVNYVPSLVSMAANVVIVPFAMFFLLKDWREIRRGFVGLVPNRYFEFTLNVLHKADVHLGNYLRGQIIDALLVGLISIAALWGLGVEYYVLIGAFAGVANLIPYVGPVAGSVLAVLVSFMTGGGTMQAVWIVAAFGAIQVVDNALLHPLVIARTVELHPLLILLVVLVGGKFFGLLGLLLAVPVAAVAKVLLAETLVNLRRYRLA